jgi:hypothetical protein
MKTAIAINLIRTHKYRSLWGTSEKPNTIVSAIGEIDWLID